MDDKIQETFCGYVSISAFFSIFDQNDMERARIYT